MLEWNMPMEQDLVELKLENNLLQRRKILYHQGFLRLAQRAFLVVSSRLAAAAHQEAAPVKLVRVALQVHQDVALEAKTLALVVAPLERALVVVVHQAAQERALVIVAQLAKAIVRATKAARQEVLERAVDQVVAAVKAVDQAAAAVKVEVPAVDLAVVQANVLE